jgi:hypothetical protein
MGKFLTLVLAREEPKLSVRNLLLFSRLGIRFAGTIVKVLPLALKIVSSRAAAHTAHRHLDQLWLVLLEPEAEQD